jgi:hypothetical protein
MTASSYSRRLSERFSSIRSNFSMALIAQRRYVGPLSLMQSVPKVLDSGMREFLTSSLINPFANISFSISLIS